MFLDVRHDTVGISLSCIVGVAIRIAVFARYEPTGTIEFHQAAISAKQIFEATFLHSHGFHLYESHVLTQPPLCVALFMAPAFVNGQGYSRNLLMVWAGILCIAADVVAGLSIATFARRSGAWRGFPAIGTAATTLYIVNPIMVSSCTAFSLGCLQRAFIAVLFAKSSQGYIVSSALALALASYMDIHSIWLIFPTSLLLVTHQSPSVRIKKTVFYIILVGVFLGDLCFASSKMLGRDVWAVMRLYRQRYSFEDFTPNWGLQWYFFQEIFEDFRSFWVWVFNFHAFAYALPLLARLHRMDDGGVFLFIMYLAIMGILSPFPTLPDIAFYMIITLVAYPEFITTARDGFVFFNCMLVSLFLGPAFYHSWTISGSANANFYYFVTLFFNICHVLLVGQLCKRGMQRLKRQEVEEGTRKQQ